MVTDSTQMDRLIGHAGGHTPGPTLVCVGGVHGNEPSGIAALQRVFATIEAREISLRGRFVGLAGNLQALAIGKRFVARDLNRLWRSPDVASWSSATADGVPEHVERRDLYRAIHSYIDRASGAVTVIDLHSASAPSAPFLIFGDALRNRELAKQFPLPLILGLEEQLEGTLMEYVTGIGHCSIAIEAGQHDDPTSIDHHEAAIWLALEFAGLLTADEVPDAARHRELLARAAAGVPHILEIVYRHQIEPEDAFLMRPGFRNFEEVARNEHLADDRRGRILSPSRFRLFLPLYQGLGNDGFFLARAVSPVWLALSSWLRRSGVVAWAKRLPGVRPHPEFEHALLVNGRVARFFVREFFHLLGYRVTQGGDRQWIVMRRDTPGPRSDGSA
jgi:succinylglutamate desuccinylase